MLHLQGCTSHLTSHPDRLDCLIVAKGHTTSSCALSCHLLFLIGGHSGRLVTTANAAMRVLCTHFANAHEPPGIQSRGGLLDQRQSFETLINVVKMLAEPSVRLRMLRLGGLNVVPKGCSWGLPGSGQSQVSASNLCVLCVLPLQVVGRRGRGTTEVLVPPAPECYEVGTCSLSWGVGCACGKHVERSSPASVPEAVCLGHSSMPLWTFSSLPLC